jgi:hypothetical protein
MKCVPFCREPAADTPARFSFENEASGTLVKMTVRLKFVIVSFLSVPFTKSRVATLEALEEEQTLHKHTAS